MAQVFQHFTEVLPEKMWQHETIVQGMAPVDRRLFIRLVPERRHAGSSSSIWTRLMRACGGISKPRNSSIPKAPGRGIRRIQFIDTELTAMGVAREIRQQMTQDPIDQPRLW